MNKMNIEIEIKNQNELLRIHENNLKAAKSDTEINKINNYIAKEKMKISELEAEEAKLN